MSRPAQATVHAFFRAMQAVYSPLGFSKSYNSMLWLLTLGYLLGFTLARTTGMQLHLFTILPAGILVCFQFTPWFCHHVILFHRLNGYLVITLSLISSAGVLIVAQVSFGGDSASRTVAGALVISTTISYIMAYINIKLLQIDQHRAKMTRCWAYLATIITIRLIIFSGGAVISLLGGRFTTRRCAQIASVVRPNGAVALDPICEAWRNGSASEQGAIVEANYPGGHTLEISAALGITFGAAGWLAFWLHANAVEVYLRLTPAESDRLRQISYERQLKRGWKTAGYSGLVAERFGDANPFRPSAFLENDGRVDGTTLAIRKQSNASEDSPA
ncbi:hypothetical protein HII31_06519 [Pseudocercospora fuligena]|uniref:Uncharacterized protein n=1 Tax=Pseudocercospora fuligena TaxID=685502 RepID=A0A8H6VH36_9PEZI|nr:hypothetical protein HII31_06519 [Pseudocercospora fuligena]